MAKKKTDSQDTSSATTNSFYKGLNKDYSDLFSPEDVWYHARNLVNNSISGDLGVVGNEPSNILCVDLIYTHIGSISIIEDYWVIFSTDNTTSEIGLFKESTCEYFIISRDTQWNFNTKNLIIGQAKENFDCSFSVYWADGLNPDRILNIGDIRLGNYPDVLTDNPWPGVPYVCVDTIPGPCENCVPITPLTLDVEKTRLAAIMKIPCVKINKGLSGGQLPNGSYYATIAYSINQQRITDYFNPSQVQPLFTHENIQSSLDISFSNVEQDMFDEFQLVVVSTINQQTVARIIGYYNTQTNSISLDNINPELETVPINYIPLRSPAYEKSDAIYEVNNYLIRVAPTGRFDFNYQPLANQIATNWVMVEYPPDYYEKGGNETGYMRDEQYCFWIRWVYNTGDRSASYHIPGRAAYPWEKQPYGVNSPDNLEVISDPSYQTETWEVINTAHETFSTGAITNPGEALIIGNVVAKGKMGYWESTESYPADKPLIWNSSAHPWTGTISSDYDLCGQPIRHHKMPGDLLHSNQNGVVDLSPAQNYSHVRMNVKTPVAIRILGVEFENIKAPVDNNGNVIPGIVGYEILRSNRQGNRTIIAKGIINNMRFYREEQNGDTIYYPNYTCNYLGRDHTLLTIDANSDALQNLNPVDILRNQGRNSWNNNISRNILTFHSPDTNFESPYLSATELKLYGELGRNNNIKGQFQPVPGHPKEKLLTNVAFIVATIISVGHAAKAVKGTRILQQQVPVSFNAGMAAPAISLVTTAQSFLGLDLATTTYNGPGVGYNSGTNLTNILLGNDAATNTYITALNTATDLLTTPSLGGWGSAQNFQIEESEYENNFLPKTLQALPTFAYYWSTSSDALLDLIRVLIPYRDYVYRTLCTVDLNRLHQGHVLQGNTRRLINDSAYLDSYFNLLGNVEVNNLYRSRCIGLIINSNITDPALVDNSVQTIGSVMNPLGGLDGFNGAVNRGITWRKPSKGSFRATGSCYYAGLKVRYRNQYGQIESPKQITTGCTEIINDGNPIPESFSNNGVSQVLITQTPTILGGDVYIGRYAEKNTFFYFYDWLYNVMDGTEIDYRLKYMVNFPRFYADFSKYDTSDFLQNVGSAITNLSIGGILNSLPRGQYNLDSSTNGSGLGFTLSGLGLGLRLGVKNSYMYLFQSAVREFFVESEYNVDHRDFGDLPEEKIYDPYGYQDLKQLFDTPIIKSGNYYKYDISLGLSKVYNSFISWGNTQDRSYDPFVAENCFTYFRNRVIYSLQQNREEKKDFWRVFLVNNYNDFKDRVIAFKSISKSGAIILFEHASPLMFSGVEQLKTVSGTKITIGDGELFDQTQEALSNADPSFQHGSCQDRMSIVNTPAGIYWMSASQGKIFTVSDNIIPISDMGLKWWFAQYLKFFILDQFPDFELVNNPVAGVGCQTVYDNNNNVLYFTKKDYRLKPEYLPEAEYLGDDTFSIKVSETGKRIRIKIGDTKYFEDLSWTVSFDTKTKAWISFHDWHPTFVMSAIRGYLTTINDGQGSSIWKHGNFTHSFCNFYGKDYPFEIDYIGSTGQQVNTIRNVEYVLESYVYDQDGIDKFQVLDHNFDEAIVYNSEQVSGLLKLNISPKNNAPVILNYPKVNLTDIDILYSKEEQKMRFNQFWDITRNRGEFIINGVLAQQPIWNTELNGYIRSLNVNNLNYNKSPFERKKFRHYVNHIALTKLISNNVKMLFKLINTKLLNSPR